MIQTNTKNKSILIVEDEPLLLELYTTILTTEGFRVSQALNGVDGLHAIKEGNFDLILLDTMMPQMDGLQVLEKLAADKDDKHTRIVMLSNLDQDTIKNKALNLGAKGYLIKSDHTPDDVLAAVHKYLAN